MIERGKRQVSLKDRLAAFARLNRNAAKKLPPGPEREALLEKARKADQALLDNSMKQRPG
ncbi:hypothetical protein JQ615_22170 [Bradyrhizobium jicamae]|uniref:Transcriptional regulator n=1 Tax=Bradyrhizobium jicamae TaxID=280332 RepID=A0ABS5FMV1_9BRAD|nr:hypothetical protein [Bradyrhizobium jicamae]MBR0798102.1 hypothetical protein [Bradyrhizobium jicamae]MBR0934490.1 hypothetical protein [Bradyrhizobium jicamae]